MNIADVMSEIESYLSNDLEPELKARAKLLRGLHLYFRYESKYATPSAIKYDSEEIGRVIKRLTQIKKEHEAGKRFVDNHTKNKKKHVYRYFDTLEYLAKKDLARAKKQAKELLDFDKRFRSERTYYRHKATLKKIGLIN